MTDKPLSESLDLRTCSRCLRVREITDFPPRSSCALGRERVCRPCCRKRAHENRARRAETRAATNKRYKEKHRDGVADRQRQWVANNPFKAVEQVLQRAVRAGKIVRPDKCSRCAARGRIEGHHPDYGKPLAVVWLCVPCHRALNRIDQEDDHD